MKIIDAHIHYNPEEPYFQDIAEAAGYENTEAGLHRAFQEAGVVHGIVMGNRSLYPEDHRYPSGCSYCLGLDGRLQSRIYTKNLGDRTEERTAFEVSMMNLLPLEALRRTGERPDPPRGTPQDGCEIPASCPPQGSGVAKLL